MSMPVRRSIIALLSDVTDGCGPGTAHQLASVTTAICLESSRQS